MRLLMLILFLLSFSFFGNSTPASSDYSPVVKFSANKKFYAVSIPEYFDGRSGFTAIFETNSRKLKFKIDKYLGYDFMPSHDGKYLVSMGFEIVGDSIKWIITQTNQKGSRTFELLKTNLLIVDGGGHVIQPPQWSLDRNEISFSLKQINFIYSLKNQRRRNVDISDGFAERKHLKEEENLYNSLFELDYNSKITQQLVKSLFDSLKLQRIEEKNGMYVFVKFIVDKKGAINDIKVFTQCLDKASSNYGQEDQEVNQKISALLFQLVQKEEILERGLPYWYLTGKFYVKTAS